MLQLTNTLFAVLAMLAIFSSYPSHAIAEETKADPPIIELGTDGFTIRSADDDFSIRIGGYLQADSRFLLDDDNEDLTDTFLLRRARINLEATLFEHFSIKLLPDFGGGSAVIQDAYIEWDQFKPARLRIGKFKHPLGIERLKPATNIMFVERALTANLLPNRDVGIQLWGTPADGKFLYQAAVVNGVEDGASGDSDSNDGKDVVGRIFINPSSNASFLGGLGFGISASSGEHDSELPSYETPAQITFFSYSSAVEPDGDSFRLSPQAQYYNGPLSVIAEYVVSSHELRLGAVTDEFDHYAWQLSGGWILTGEKATTRSVKPQNKFDPSQGQWGSFQIALRYSELNVDNDAFSRGFADSSVSASEARAWAIGLNWYWNPNVKLVLNFERTAFEGGSPNGDRDDENAILTRFQLAF